MAKSGDAVTAAAERAARATQLIEAGAYIVTEGSVYVFSDTAGVPGYSVTPEDGCPCRDATLGEAARLGISCKHRAAAELILAGRTQTPRRLPPRDDAAWLDEQDEAARRRRAAARLEQIAEEMAR